MNNERYDDEVLSAIIDGEADPQTVASVEADPIASERLARMRQGVLLVAEPVPSPNPERRTASIAAALAAATPAPEVTSLAAARHERDAKQKRSAPKRAWIAGVAAAAAFLVAIPVAISLGGSPDAETTAADAVEEVAAEATADESADDADAMEDETTALQDSGADDGDAEQDSFVDNRDEVAEAMEDDAANDPRASRVNTSDLETANTVGEIDVLILDNLLAPKYDASAVIVAGVNESCVRPREGVTSDLPFDLVNLDSFGGAARLVLIEFADDGTTRVLDAEDCASLR